MFLSFSLVHRIFLPYLYSVYLLSPFAKNIFPKMRTDLPSKGVHLISIKWSRFGLGGQIFFLIVFFYERLARSIHFRSSVQNFSIYLHVVANSLQLAAKRAPKLETSHLDSSIYFLRQSKSEIGRRCKRSEDEHESKIKMSSVDESNNKLSKHCVSR